MMEAFWAVGERMTHQELGLDHLETKEGRVGPSVWAPVEPRILFSQYLALCEDK